MLSRFLLCLFVFTAPVVAAEFQIKTQAPLVVGKPNRLILAAESLRNVWGLQLEFKIDGVSLLEPQSKNKFDKPVWLSGKGWSKAPFELANELSMLSGESRYIASMTAPAEPLKGSVEIAAMDILPREPGQIRIQLGKALFGDADGRAVEVATQAVYELPVYASEDAVPPPEEAVVNWLYFALGACVLTILGLVFALIKKR